jgi:hypothetical protein
MNAVALLKYSLDDPSHGINCRSKAQILNEMCLSLGLYSRKVWLMPYSPYDIDCHVVNEIWDSTLQKWIMLDITNNEYWVDDTGALSVLEIRKKGANQEFCTPVKSGDSLTDLSRLRTQYQGDFLYIMKNMVSMKYCTDYTVGETQVITLIPKNLDLGSSSCVSQKSILADPMSDTSQACD